VGKENEETSGCIHYLDRLAGETRQSQRCEDSAAVSHCSQPAKHKVSVVVSCKSQQLPLAGHQNVEQNAHG
jgi:hypothetical protein